MPSYEDLDYGALFRSVNRQPPADDASKSRGFVRGAGDLGLEVASGVTRGVGMLASTFGANNPVASAARSTDEFIREYLSAQSKEDSAQAAAILAEAEDQGIGAQVVAGLRAFGQAPLSMLANTVGMAVPTIAGGAAALGGRAAAGGARAIGTMAGVGAASGVGEAKGGIFDSVKAEYMKGGMSAPEAEAKAEEAQAYGNANSGSLAVAGGLGALAGSTGFQPVAARLLKGSAAGATQTGMLRSLAGNRAADFAETATGKALAGGLVEGGTEFLQGGQQQHAANVALQNEGFDTPTWRGVVSQGAMEAIAGGVVGAGFGALDRKKLTVADVLGAPDLDTAIDFSMEMVSKPAGKAEEALERAKKLELAPLTEAPVGTLLDADAGFNGMLPNVKGAPPAFKSKRDADIYIGSQALFQSHETVQVAPDKWEVRQTAATQALMKPNTLLPVGEAAEFDVAPAGEAAELIPAGDATELQNIPVGDAFDPGGTFERTMSGIAADADQARGKQRRVDELDAIPGIAKAQDEQAAILAKAATLESPSAMAEAFKRAKPTEPASTAPAEPRIVKRTADMVPTSLEKAQERVDTIGGEVVRVQNQSGKFAYVAMPSATRPGDLLTGDQMPYGSKLAANLRAKREGLGLEHVIQIPDAGWVVRPSLPAPATSGNADQATGPASGNAGTALTVPADPAPTFGAGTRITLNGAPYTVIAANNTAVRLQGADGGTKMVARNSKAFAAIQQEPNEAARPQAQAAGAEAAAPAAGGAVGPTGRSGGAVEGGGLIGVERSFGAPAPPLKDRVDAKRDKAPADVSQEGEKTNTSAERVQETPESEQVAPDAGAPTNKDSLSVGAATPAVKDSLTAAEPKTKRPPKSFRKTHMVETSVFVEETGKFEPREVDADTAIKALDADIAELAAFRKCIAGG